MAEARESPSVGQLRKQWQGRGAVATSRLIENLLRTHPGYIGNELDDLTRLDDPLPALGSARTVEEHLAAVRGRWHEQRTPVISGRHAILGLALDRGVGRYLLRGGVIGSLLSRWQPGRGTADEPQRLVWDVLSDGGRALAEQQPLLAAAFGAPAEATMLLPLLVSARAMAWSPAGDRLAVLAGGTVYETRPATGTAHPVGELGEAVQSIGWGSQGVVGLSIDGGRATLLRARDGAPLGDWDGVTAGVLSGDGSHAWLQTTGGVYQWAPPAEPARLTSPGYSEPATPVAVDWTGRHGLLRLPKNSVLVAALPPGSRPEPSVGRDPYWPGDAAPMVGWGPPRSSRCALLTFRNRFGVAYAAPDGVDLWQLRGLAAEGARTQAQLNVCRIATGPGEASALAVDPTGTRLAVAIGSRVAVWSLAEQRASATPIPAYDTDRPDRSDDLLGADRDARAIAALVSARDVHPPLSIGLFGAWGSGKSFILRQVSRLLAATDRPAGYLRYIRVVEFNAWQYAETNLWASLVDRVLQVIAPVKPPASPPEVTEAATRAQEAARTARAAVAEVERAERELEAARERLEKRRRRAALLVAAVLVLAAGAAVALLLGAAGRLVAAASAALALLSAAAGVLGQARKARDQATDIANASRTGIATVGRLLGRPEELAVQAKGAELRRLEERSERATAEADRLTTARDRVAELAREQPLGALLHRLATISDYRDQLSLVSRTRDHFDAVDQAIRDARDHSEPYLERVIIIIDDLDRCPPEKVVSVLEAVHLLFSFEMFVVLIAVDTRWLEQSLRIRYRQLLGGAASAVPTDYLEKIIQIPLHLPPLNESLARAMIAGLTRVTATPEPAAAPEPAGAGPAPEPTGGPHQPAAGRPLAATVPRVATTPLPAEVMLVTPADAAAMSAVAPLTGTTPRSVKRFVNTYRLLKARAVDPDRFDGPGGALAGGLGDHEVVAFLLAVVTGQPAVAEPVLAALVDAAAGVTAEAALAGPADGTDPIRAWFAGHRRYAEAPAQRYAGWAGEVGRYSFTPPAR